MAISVKSSSSSDDESPEPIVAEINITPLVDIFLVLLIIFMVSSSVMSQMGVEVKLPQSTVSAQSQKPEGVIITLLPDGASDGSQVKLNGKPLSLTELEAATRTALGTTSQKLVILEGDERAMLGKAVSVMDIAKRAGASGFSIATRSGQ